MRVVQSSWGFHECSCTSGIYQICLAWMLNTFSCSCEADALFILDLETSGPNQDVNQDSVPVPTLHHLVQCKSLRNSCKLFFQFGFMLRGGGVGLNCAVVSKRLCIISYQDTNFVRNLCQILFTDVLYHTSGHYYLCFSRSWISSQSFNLAIL